MTTHRKSTLKPAGWLGLAVLAVLGLGLIGLLIRPLTEPIRSLPEVGAGSAGTLNPTITPYVKPSLTLAPGATPLPAGWTQAPGLNGQLVFVPSAEIQQQITAAFEAVWACELVEDAPDSTLRKLDLTALCTAARLNSTDAISVGRGQGNAVEIVTSGRLNPIECASLTTCDMARAKLEVKGVVLFGDVCTQVKQSSPCIVRQGLTGLQPYQLRLATLALQEDGTWKVVNWTTVKLPGPPPSP